MEFVQGVLTGMGIVFCAYCFICAFEDDEDNDVL